MHEPSHLASADQACWAKRLSAAECVNHQFVGMPNGTNQAQTLSHVDTAFDGVLFKNRSTISCPQRRAAFAQQRRAVVNVRGWPLSLGGAHDQYSEYR